MPVSRGEVLVVDDDPDVLGLLEAVLRAEGFTVRAVGSATEALASVKADRPDVVLLDLMLADSDGLDVLTEIRTIADIPVVLLTGRGAEADRVLGLRMGAEDYVVKPFSPPELVARIDNILRRAAQRPGTKPLKFGALCIDLESREVVVNGTLVPTTAKEFDLLAYLAGSPRQVLSRNQLLQQVWASSSEWQDEATVTEHVRRLRLKIESDPERPRWIVTVRGLGYRFDP
jgi:DNA-binding response OmpR family regulator